AARLVSLQVPDHVPPELAEVGELGCFALELLGVALAEIPMPRRVQLPNRCGRVPLRDGDQPHRARRAPGALRGAGDASFDGLEVRGESHGVVRRSSAVAVRRTWPSPDAALSVPRAAPPSLFATSVPRKARRSVVPLGASESRSVSSSARPVIASAPSGPSD